MPVLTQRWGGTPAGRVGAEQGLPGSGTKSGSPLHLPAPPPTCCQHVSGQKWTPRYMSPTWQEGRAGQRGPTWQAAEEVGARHQQAAPPPVSFSPSTFGDIHSLLRQLVAC